MLGLGRFRAFPSPEILNTALRWNLVAFDIQEKVIHITSFKEITLMLSPAIDALNARATCMARRVIILMDTNHELYRTLSSVLMAPRPCSSQCFPRERIYYYAPTAYPLDPPSFIHVGGSGFDRMELWSIGLHLYIPFVSTLVVSIPPPARTRLLCARRDCIMFACS